MKLTKLQRHTAYIILLAEFEESFGFEFFCDAVYSLFDWPFGEGTIRDYLPELYRHKPATLDDSGGWFSDNEDGVNTRIKLLKQCIEETY
jgi:hypothetical protein